jgi:hypothetical protein
MSWREPARLSRVATGLWVAWAVVTWSVVFDHVIELAGRRYLRAAAQAAETGAAYARIDQWMRPAATTALWTASAAAAAILIVGVIGIRLAGTWSRPCA